MHSSISFLTVRRPRTSTLFPYTTLFRSRTLEELPGRAAVGRRAGGCRAAARDAGRAGRCRWWWHAGARFARSEEHTSELQSQFHLVCRLLLEKKNIIPTIITPIHKLNIL